MSTRKEHDAESPVLVVGGGPAGLSAALALGRLGVTCLLVERRAGVGGHPRATGVRTRTMELFRDCGSASWTPSPDCVRSSTAWARTSACATTLARAPHHPLRRDGRRISTLDLVDLARVWPRLYGVGDRGACLVRPDGHVAWRTAEPPDATAERAEQTLGDVLDRVLART